MNLAQLGYNKVLQVDNARSAERLSKAVGRSSESWLAMQYQYDLWHAKKVVDLKSVKKMKFKAA